MPEVLFEVWVAPPNRVAFVRTDNRSVFAARPGWWSTDKQLTLDEVLATGHKPYEVIKE